MVKAQGKVRVKRNSRDIHGESIGLCSLLYCDSTRERMLNERCCHTVRCRGLREELEHWQRVTALHKNYYFLPERFVIPPLSGTNVVGAQDVPRTPKSTKVIASLASTPSTHSTASSSSTSSPAKSSSEDSTVRFKPAPRLPADAPGNPEFYLTLIFHASFYRDFVTHPVSAAVTSRKIHSGYM